MVQAVDAGDAGGVDGKVLVVGIGRGGGGGCRC